ncbi:ornithine decarboxylase 2-like [Bombus affinis]|uniref:ornithine decarboxylase 2-like n=1 Tax=Bombus affinis TaxID=309941 RepID=UPI0021B71798|nr:ornithine decarboxylase 2-like [Bombus affinis]
MSHSIYDEVKVFEDTDENTDIIKSFIKTEHESTEEPFCVLDVADVMQKHQNWIAKMPRIVTYYAVKCNADPFLLKILAVMNVNFDCASQQEIRMVMKLGVSPNRIIFANPAKWTTHIKFAKMMNVEKMTVDSEMEIIKIRDIFPEAKVIIRIRCDAKNVLVSLGTKFGCDPDEEAVRLIHLTKSLGLKLWGFSFHVGYLCSESDAYVRGIRACKKLISIAKEIGCKDVQLIDIGGGFPGNKGYSIDEVARRINNEIEDIDPSISVISEPGQYYATSAYTLVSLVHTKRVVRQADAMVRMYYMNCGVYNGFIEEMLNLKERLPIPVHKPASDAKFLSYVWGPTCDSMDCILKNVMLPEFHQGDWLAWMDIGSYSICLSSPFNGFSPPKVHPYARESQWKKFIDYTKRMQKSQE